MYRKLDFLYMLEHRLSNSRGGISNPNRLHQFIHHASELAIQRIIKLISPVLFAKTVVDEACPKLHGSAATDDFMTFGCSDGVLAIDLTQSTYPAIKLSNPESLIEDSRIGTIYSHHDANEFVGVAGDQFFVIDMSTPSSPYQELSIPDGVARVTQGFSTHAKTFYILGDDGNLYLFGIDSDWSASEPVKVTEALTEDSITPAITMSKAKDTLFILSTNGQKVFEVDSNTGATLRTINLDFTASKLAWLGLSEEHEHDH